jgi:hypothetical protein
MVKYKSVRTPPFLSTSAAVLDGWNFVLPEPGCHRSRSIDGTTTVKKLLEAI